MKRSYWIAAAAIAALALVGGGSFLIGQRTAGHHHETPRTVPDVQGQAVIELGRALAIAAQHVPGEVVKVELERDEDRFTYEVKVLTANGRVREIKLDAHDGSLIEIEDD